MPSWILSLLLHTFFFFSLSSVESPWVSKIQSRWVSVSLRFLVCSKPWSFPLSPFLSLVGTDMLVSLNRPRFFKHSDSVMWSLCHEVPYVDCSGFSLLVSKVGHRRTDAPGSGLTLYQLSCSQPRNNLQRLYQPQDTHTYLVASLFRGKKTLRVPLLEQSLAAGSQKRFFLLNLAPNQPVSDNDKRRKGTKALPRNGIEIIAG